MKPIRAAFFFILISFLFSQCQKEKSFNNPVDPGNTMTNPITVTVQGNIVDESGYPASGVTITAGNKTTFTDIHGYFRIREALLDKNSAVVTAEKQGYFRSYRTFIASSGVNQVMIKLSKKTLSAAFDGTTGGEISLSNGAKISLPANGFVIASNNTAYTGNVNVYAMYINPSSPEINQTVPGSFMADDKNKKRVILKSYGMLAVELESSSGERLQIADGKTARLTIPIPTSIQSPAPASISLWYVDEKTGIWKEEGDALKTGTGYVGDVKHFTFWNCDVGSPAVKLSLTIQTPDGVSLAYSAVTLKSLDSSYGHVDGFTDSLGQVSGLVPANTGLVIEIHDQCNNVIFSENIGPYSLDTDLGIVTVPNSLIPVTTVKGTLLNCDNKTTQKGYVIIYNDGDNFVRYAAVTQSGEFSISFIRCTGGNVNYKILGVDESANQQGNASYFTVSAQNTDIGNIVACGFSAEEYINYSLNGTNYTIVNARPGDSSLVGYTYPTLSSPPYTTLIAGYFDSNKYLSFRFDNSKTNGVYPIEYFAIQQYDSIRLIQPFNVTITNFPATTGGFYEGSFAGQFKDLPTSDTHNINGTFRVRTR